MDKILDRIVNLAIITVSIVFVGVVVNKYLIANKSSPPLAAEIPIGKQIDLPGVNWESNRNTVVVALRKGCPYCDESAPFYQRLNSEIFGRKNVSILAVLPDTVENSREHLKKLNIPFGEVREARLKSVKVSATPTLLLVDKTGAIVAGWVGKLSHDEENKVLETLARLN